MSCLDLLFVFLFVGIYDTEGLCCTLTRAEICFFRYYTVLTSVYTESSYCFTVVLYVCSLKFGFHLESCLSLFL